VYYCFDGMEALNAADMRTNLSAIRDIISSPHILCG
jgi:hypothetical protein